MTHAEMIALFEILLVNFVLSGDNALVIASVAALLPKRQRVIAIVYGTAATILLRVWMTMVAQPLLELPFIQSIGAVLLSYLALSLLMGEGNKAVSPVVHGPKHMIYAIGAIVLADLTMSLDNVVAVAGIAQGHRVTLLIGLVLSITVIMFASASVASAIAQYFYLRFAGAAVLAATAGSMLGHDPFVRQWLHPFFGPTIILGILVAGLTQGIQFLRSND